MTEAKQTGGSSTQKAPNIKTDWYQTESKVVLVLLIKNVDKDKLRVNFAQNLVSVSLELPDNSDYSRNFTLAYSINQTKSSYQVYPTKVEIHLVKIEALHWSKLEDEEQKQRKEVKLNFNKWDKMVSELEEDKPEGEAALNALFQKIYSDGSDEVKKAMNKSFLESGGTELNTNWDAVSKDKVSIKPPDGMEWKQWDK